MARSERGRRRLLFAALAGASTMLLVACAGIIGLDDFHRGECPGAKCEGGTSPDVNVPDSPFMVEGGGMDAGPGTGPVSWAHWPMPNYDAGDADVENSPKYTTGMGFVTDTITGLTWLQPTPMNPQLTYTDAVAFCKSQAGGPWRLPTRIELVSLLDFGAPSGARLVGTAFSGTASGQHWSSSPERDRFGNAAAPEGARRYWTVSFESGAVNLQSETNANAFKCVKGGS